MLKLKKELFGVIWAGQHMWLGLALRIVQALCKWHAMFVSKNKILCELLELPECQQYRKAEKKIFSAVLSQMYLHSAELRELAGKKNLNYFSLV